VLVAHFARASNFAAITVHYRSWLCVHFLARTVHGNERLEKCSCQV
jgi:hypothetical protein